MESIQLPKPFDMHPLPWRVDRNAGFGGTVAIRDSRGLYVMACVESLADAVVGGVNGTLASLAVRGTPPALELAKLIGLHPTPWRAEPDPDHPSNVYLYDATGALVLVECSDAASILMQGQAAAVNLAHAMLFGKGGAA